MGEQSLFPPSRRAWLATAVGAAALGKPVFGAVKPDITLRFSHVVAEETPKGLAANRFKVLVEQRTGGRIGVQVYPNAQLYGDHDEMQALQLGAVDLVAPSLSKFGRIGLPEFELFDLPFMFDDLAAVRRITLGPLGQKLLQGLPRQGLVGLGFFDNGFKQMSANRPLLEPEDFAGLRMRVQASRVIAAQMRALGARPVTLPFSETRRALACWRKQAPVWESPNAGPVMAAGAGSLGIALGGAAIYHGQEEIRPPLGQGPAPVAADLYRAISLVKRSLWLWLAVLFLITGALHA